MNRSGYTLIDGLVLCGVLAAIAAALIGVRQRLSQADAIMGCQANLKQLYQALTQYTHDNHGAFPRTVADTSTPLTAYTAPTAADPFSADGPAANDVTAGAFLLARTQGVPAGTFVCPGAMRNGLAQKDDFTAESVMRRANFRARIFYNYSLANMYPDVAALANGYSLDHFIRLGSGFTIAADMNAGDETTNPATQRTTIESRLANSPNHQRDGQNALRADGSITFVPTPYGKVDASFYASDGIFPQPANAHDSVLLPVWKAGDQAAPTAVRLRRWVFTGALVFSILLIAGAVAQSLRKQGRAAL